MPALLPCRYVLTVAVAVALASAFRIGLSSAQTVAGDGATGTATAMADFDRTVAPILARHCLDCHAGSDPKGKLDLSRRGSTLAGGVTGPAVVPGSPGESLLWERVEGNEMPPRHPLSQDEKTVLKAWIEAGAGWGTDPVDPFQVTTNKRAGRDWWSLQPLGQPVLPELVDPAWSAPIDRFVRDRLKAEGLSPTPEADRRTLIRRVTFNLTGLPPTPAEVEAFLSDPNPGAYERLVKRLLDSPQYGAHQARHWLDLARFAESHGFEFDEFRPGAWRYRDWVVQALNRDMPYNEFARLQLAGDVLEPHNPASVEATGFLAAGPFDTAGQGQQSAAMRAVVRQDELEDLIGTTSQTFLGLTLNCARCHDHKFDPVKQDEYYRFAAAFAGVRQGERDLSGIDPVRKQVEEELATDRLALADLERPVRVALLAEANAGALRTPAAAADLDPVAAWDFTRPQDASQNTGPALTLHGGARFTPEGLHVGGPDGGYGATEPLKETVRERTLEAWVKLDRLDQGGGAVLSLLNANGSVFDAIVYAERQPGRWMAGSDGFVRTQDLLGEFEQEAAAGVVQIAITYAADGTITVYRNGAPYAGGYKTNLPVEYPAGGNQVLFGLRHGPPTPGRLLDATIVRARVYGRSLTAAEVAASCARGGLVVTSEQIAARLTGEQKQEWDRLRNQISERRDQFKALTARRAYVVAPRAPEPSRLLVRGTPGQPAAEVTPGAVAALSGVNADFGLALDAPDADRRARLAAWITDPANPLFPRVIVNRLWQSHFGVGLVETSSDFGFSGGKPTHPELLDWLARRLIDSGWSLKALHQEIVMSAAYRQGGAVSPQALKVDASNRWIWRHAPARLEAEMVRDAMFATAGLLDLRLGGPSYQDYALAQAVGTAAVHYLAADPGTPGFNRRTLYRAWTRGGRNTFLDAFDCPDPSTTAPRRNVSNTPIQALSLMNNAVVLYLSDALAARLEREAGPEAARRAEQAYRLVLNRPPSEAELQEAATVVQQFSAAVLARALYNSNEFLYVD